MNLEQKLAELKRRDVLAEEGGGKERRERQHKEGKMSARERIEFLLDEGAFEEFDKNSGRFLAGSQFSKLIAQAGAHHRFVVAHQVKRIWALSSYYEHRPAPDPAGPSPDPA